MAIGTNNAPKYNQGISKPKGGLSSIWDNYNPIKNDSGAVTTINNGPKYNQGINGGLSDSFKKSLGTSSKSGSGTGTTSNSSDAAAYLASLYANRNNNAQANYDAALARINNAYDTAAQSYGDIYNRGISALDASYKAQQDKLNSQAADSLREAYINRRLSERDLPQQLAAMGISGGASETSLLNLVNSEGNARASINRGLNDNLADLASNYNDNANNLFSAYQQQLAGLANTRASALNDLEMQLANQNNDYETEYLKFLASNPEALNAVMAQSLASQAAVTPTADMSANNTVASVDTTQASPLANTSKYAQLLAAAKLTNDTPTTLALKLRKQGYTNDQIADIVTQYANA